ncbi:MAG: DNA-3-methyladenine glycosylase [Planctomycetota bacterium]
MARSPTTWRFEGHHVARVARPADLPADGTWVVAADVLPSLGARLARSRPLALHVVPGATDGTPAQARRTIERACRDVASHLGDLPLVAHASTLDGVRHALAAEEPANVSLHARTRCAHTEAWLAFRNAWPAWWGGRDAPPSPAVTGALELARRDDRFHRLVRLGGPPLSTRRPSTFATIARAIVYQQLSGRAASTIWGRLEAKLGGGVDAARVARTRTPTLRAAGLSAAKAAALQDLAARVASGSLKPGGLARRSDGDVIDALTAVRGIGPWSAQMHLIFSLGRPDVWPVLDLGVRKGMARWYGLDPEPDLAGWEAFGEAFRPWRTVAAWYAWRATEIPDALLPGTRDT